MAIEDIKKIDPISDFPVNPPVPYVYSYGTGKDYLTDTPLQKIALEGLKNGENLD